MSETSNRLHWIPISYQFLVIEKLLPVAESPLPAVEIRAPPVIGTIKAILNVADILLDTKLSM